MERCRFEGRKFRAMSVDVLRAKLIKQLGQADEASLQRVQKILGSEAESADLVGVPQHELDIAYARRDAYLRGEGQSYTMEEAHALIREVVAKK